MMAARAIGPLVGKSHIVSTLKLLAELLVPPGNTRISQNAVHGGLLQVMCLLNVDIIVN